MSIDPFHTTNTSDTQAVADCRDLHPLLKFAPS